jgi:hypothetical protein
VAWTGTGMRLGRWLTSGGARPPESCASGGRWGVGVVQAALASGGGGLGVEAGHATREGHEA